MPTLVFAGELDRLDSVEQHLHEVVARIAAQRSSIILGANRGLVFIRWLSFLGAKWYLAELVQELRVAGDDRNDLAQPHSGEERILPRTPTTKL